MRRHAGVAPSAILGVVLAVAVSATPASADAPRFALPLDCTVGETCFLQNYFDTDPGPEARDYRCGPMVYDGHEGTDFRTLPGTALPVLAMAKGTVLRVRDGEPDRTLSGPSLAVAGRGLGNAVVIDHGGGWRTVSGHLASGSVRVRPGQTVSAGEVLGTVGLSGLTEFRHVHVEILLNGALLDPFTGRTASGRCGEPGEPLWSADALTAIRAAGETHILAVGLAGAVPDLNEILDGAVQPLSVGDPIAAGYGVVMGIAEGDVQRLIVDGPDVMLRDDAPHPRFQAQAMRFLGRRLADGVRPGQYRVRYQVMRDNRVVDEAVATINLTP